jgi:putative ATP-dependent endonuclease of OLD family
MVSLYRYAVPWLEKLTNYFNHFPMFISEVKIKGFRSFGHEVTIHVKRELSAFIGLNSSGKTSALEALRKVFGAQAERDIRFQDFHIGKDEEPEKILKRELSIEIKLDFIRPKEEEEEPQDEVKETDVDKLSEEDDSQSDENSVEDSTDMTEEEKDVVPHFFSSMVVEEAGAIPYVRIRLEASWEKVEYDPEGILEINTYFIKVAEGEADVKYPLPSSIKSLFQILYVPAIRRPAEQLRYASGSILHRVLRKIRYKEDFKKGFENKIDEINTAFKDLPEMLVVQEAIASYWGKFHKDERYRDSSLGFGGSDFESVLKKLEISFSPTPTDRKFQIDDLGEGYRSLFYLTLVCALLEIEEKLEEAKAVEEREETIGITRPLMTILTIEEPENHIAPQLLGRVVSILKTLAAKPNCQVFISSHTPAIIRRISAEAIYHFRITEVYETQVNEILLPEKKDEAYKFIKEAVYNYPEIYFSRLVVIGEGDSEEVIFDRLMKVKDTDFDDNVITFVPLGGRFINHIWRLLNHLNIPYLTLLDLDLERGGGGGWGRVKYAIKQLLLNGADKTILLELDGNKVLADEELEKMHNWKMEDKADVAILQQWIVKLREYHVFYSTPLDLDFLMLKTFFDYYKKAIPKGGGPDIPDETDEAAEYQEKLIGAVRATLKSEKAEGNLYSEDHKKLMIWYNYHFLGRGKPSTHIHALSLIPNNILTEKLPKVFDLMFEKIKELIKTGTR